MSGYNGRRGPNVSQYIAQLNTIPSQQELRSEPPTNLEEDFSLFTNADFFDIDGSASNIDLNSSLDFNLDFDDQQSGGQASAATNSQTANNANEPGMDFNMNSDFQFADFSNFPNPMVDPSIQNLPHPQPGSYPVPHSYTSPVSASISPVTQGFDHSADKKRRLDSTDASAHLSLDEQARVAAEEDKRRRNTAASARFRVKKKQREQEMEKKAKEMTEKVTKLETRIQQLETENAWLKGLITEKNGTKSATTEIKAMLNRHDENNSERHMGSHTDGVGTVKSESSKA